jgi:hypothetical protein
MPDANADEPIGDDELLLRRIPLSQNWVTDDKQTVDPLAFRPRESDVTGLSFGRLTFNDPGAEAAKGAAGRRFFVALLSVRLIRKEKMAVVPRPLVDDPGHAEIVDLTFANRRSDRARELVQRLRECVIEIQGPFDGKRSPK